MTARAAGLSAPLRCDADESDASRIRSTTTVNATSLIDLAARPLRTDIPHQCVRDVNRASAVADCVVHWLIYGKIRSLTTPTLIAVMHGCMRITELGLPSPAHRSGNQTDFSDGDAWVGSSTALRTRGRYFPHDAMTTLPSQYGRHHCRLA